MKWKMIVIAAVMLFAASGCAASAQNKSPEQLLSLSVSGLAGIDRYAFSGMTGSAVEGGTMLKPVPFSGTVENHNQIQIQSSGDRTGDLSLHPLEMMEQVEKSAGKTELVAAESGNRTAVLRVQADPAKAAELWRNNLRSGFDKVKEMAESSSAVMEKGAQRAASSPATEAAYRRARENELSRSAKELDKMLSTLQVDTTYRVVVDRIRLVPLKLEESTVLRYTTAGGDKRQEQRKMSLDFKPLPQ